MAHDIRIAVDIGGTFTDVALMTSGGRLATFKLLSTPADYAEAVVHGVRELLRQLELTPEDVEEVLHGCTVATNAILEQKGATTALITTKGFRDVLELRRTRVPRLYDPLYQKPAPLVPRRWRYEVRERIDATGQEVSPLDRDDLQRIVESIKAVGVEAVAICLLHAYANATHEQSIARVLREELPHCFISLSSDILPQMREYERTSTTVINSYVGPPVRKYLVATKNVGTFMLVETQRNTPALFGAGLVDLISDKAIKAAASKKHRRWPDVSGRLCRLKDGKIGRFGWKAQIATLHDFTVTACAVIPEVDGGQAVGGGSPRAIHGHAVQRRNS